jgi:hypothetical protein
MRVLALAGSVARLAARPAGAQDGAARVVPRPVASIEDRDRLGGGLAGGRRGLRRGCGTARRPASRGRAPERAQRPAVWHRGPADRIAGRARQSRGAPQKHSGPAGRAGRPARPRAARALGRLALLPGQLAGVGSIRSVGHQSLRTNQRASRPSTAAQRSSCGSGLRSAVIRVPNEGGRLVGGLLHEISHGLVFGLIYHHVPPGTRMTTGVRFSAWQSAKPAIRALARMQPVPSPRPSRRTPKSLLGFTHYGQGASISRKCRYFVSRHIRRIPASLDGRERGTQFRSDRSGGRIAVA